MNNDSADLNEKELIIYIYMSQTSVVYRLPEAACCAVSFMIART
jgi:hypothetical protein